MRGSSAEVPRVYGAPVAFPDKRKGRRYPQTSRVPALHPSGSESVAYSVSAVSYPVPTFGGECSPPHFLRARPTRGGFAGTKISCTLVNMSKKLQPPPATNPESVLELEHLYAQLAAVEALIRALEVYRQFYPNLVPSKRKSA